MSLEAASFPVAFSDGLESNYQHSQLLAQNSLGVIKGHTCRVCKLKRK